MRYNIKFPFYTSFKRAGAAAGRPAEGEDTAGSLCRIQRDLFCDEYFHLCFFPGNSDISGTRPFFYLQYYLPGRVGALVSARALSGGSDIFILAQADGGRQAGSCDTGSRICAFFLLPGFRMGGMGDKSGFDDGRSAAADGGAGISGVHISAGGVSERRLVTETGETVISRAAAGRGAFGLCRFFVLLQWFRGF